MKRARRQKDRRGTPKRPIAMPTPRSSLEVPWIQWLRIATVLLLGIASAANLYACLRIWLYPVDANMGEGIVLYEAQRLAGGLPIYKALNEPPYWFATYPPLYQFLVSLWDPGNLVWARMISLVSSCWCAAALGLIVWQATRLRLAGALAGLLWLTSSFVIGWTALARVDMLGRGLESAAVFCVWTLWGRRGRVPAAAIFASLAMLTKQTMVAGGLTCFLVLWFESRRRGALFMALWVGITSACYLILIVATSGYFWQNVFVNVARGFNAAILLYWIRGFCEEHWGVMLACALAIIRLWIRMAGGGAGASDRSVPAGRSAMLLFGAAVVGGIPGAVLAGNDGVDVNYFFDLAWGLFGFLACALNDDRLLMLVTRVGSTRAAKSMICAWIAVLAYGLVMVAAPIEGPSTRQYAVARQLLRSLAGERKPVLAEFVGYGLLAGSTPEYLPYMYKKLEDAGQWKPDPIIENVRKKKYGAILLSSAAKGRWSAAIMGAIEQNYRLRTAYEGTFMVEGEMVQLYFVPK